VPHRFWYIVFSFSLNSRNLLISSFISSITHRLLNNVLFSLQLFAYFLLLILLLSSCFIALWWAIMQRCYIYFFIFIEACFFALRYDLFWTKFHGLLRRMDIVHLPEEIFWRHKLGTFDLWYHLGIGFLCW
jgi:hypothetical protein